MASEYVIRARKDDRILSLYQVDPTFYNKILSRSSSFDFSHRKSFYYSPGKVPFMWEMQPGTPKDNPASIEIVAQVRLPPAVHGLNMPKPRIPSTGTTDYLWKNIKKAKRIKNVHFRVPTALRTLSMQRPAISSKAYLVKNIKKVKKIKKIKNLVYSGKKKEENPNEERGSPTSEVDEIYGFIFSSFDENDNSTPTTAKDLSGLLTSFSTPCSSFSSLPSSPDVAKSSKVQSWSLPHAIKSSKARSWSLPHVMKKLKLVKGGDK